MIYSFLFEIMFVTSIFKYYSLRITLLLYIKYDNLKVVNDSFNMSPKNWVKDIYEERIHVYHY